MNLEPRRSPALAILLAALLAWPWAVSSGQDDAAESPRPPAASAGSGRVVSPHRDPLLDPSEKPTPQLSVTDDEDDDGPGRLPVSFFEAGSSLTPLPLVISDVTRKSEPEPVILRLLRAQRLRC